MSQDGSTPPTTRKDSVEGLKDKLYSRKEAPRTHPDIRTPLSQDGARAPVAWSDAGVGRPLARSPFRTTGNEKPRMSMSMKFFLGSVAFFVVAAAAAAYMFFLGGRTISPQNIDLSIVAPSLIDGGKEAQLQILIHNRNSASLQLVDLILNYPDGTRDASDQTTLLSHERQTVGTIAPGEQVKRTANAIFYGQEGTIQTVNATLQYSIAGSNAIFEKKGEVSFTIGSSPVSVRVMAPQAVIAGQEFGIDVVVQSNAVAPVDTVVIQGQYPFGFSVVRATPPADAGGTLWRLGTMKPGSSQTIHLVATQDGQSGDQRILRFLAGQNSDPTDTKIQVPFVSVPTTLAVERPFIAATIAVNNQTGKTVQAPSGSQVQGSITWQNNLTDSVSNVQLVLTLGGATLDKSSIASQSGFYQSSNSTITWTSAQEPSLANAAPGAQGMLPFSFSTLPPGAGGTIYTNPTVDLSLTVAGTRQGGDSTPQNVTAAASVQVVLSSLLELSAAALHFSGAFTNAGPMPPKAESSTSYTVVWTVKNSSNAVANAAVSAVLPTYVQFAQGEQGSGITYDKASRTVLWNIGDLKAGAGYSAPTRSASFQIMLTPSASQVGSAPELTGTAMLRGQDRFAQVQVEASANGPTTALTGDGAFQPGMANVVQK